MTGFETDMPRHPIAYTESINRLAWDKNREGREVYSFEVMQARMLYPRSTRRSPTAKASPFYK